MTAIRTFRRHAGVAAVLAMACAGTAAAAPEFVAFAPLANPPPTITANTLDGATIALEPAPDRTVLVHFFATWCAPCKDELPELARFAAGRRDHVRVIGVDVGEPASRVAAFVAPLGLGFPVTLDEDRAIARAFGVRALPSTVMLAPRGAPAAMASGPVDWGADHVVKMLEDQRSIN